MPNRYGGILFSLVLVAGFVIGLFIQPSSSQANPNAAWQGEYFANSTLEGTPVVTATDDVIDMNWFMSAPYENLPADFFSVRWTASANFAEGIYRFRVGADDGIRLLIDEKLVIDAFTAGTFRTLTRDVRLSAGEHRLVVEYFEGVGSAGVLVDWTPTDNPGEVMDLETLHTENVSDNSPIPLAHIAASVVHAYAAPLRSAPRIAQLRLYQQYPILGISSDGAWYKIELAQGFDGWIPIEVAYPAYTDAIPVLTEAVANNSPIHGTAAAALKLRPTPLNTRQVDTIPQGESFEILSRDSSGSWFFIQRERSDAAEPLTGWVFAPYVHIMDGELANLNVFAP